MISEGSCDTEDWSNDAENSVLITDINYSLKVFKFKSVIFNSKKKPVHNSTAFAEFWIKYMLAW